MALTRLNSVFKMATPKDENVVEPNSMCEEEYQRCIREKNKAVKELYNNIPTGRRKSGKFWKNPRDRIATIKKDKCMKSSWNEKMKKRLEAKTVKAYEKELKEKRNTELREKRLGTEERQKRKLENSRKNEIIQKITNLKKLKKMKKKHLRNIEMR